MRTRKGRVLLFVSWYLLLPRLGECASSSPDEIPPLEPPHSEIMPGFWEQHGVSVILGGFVVLGLLTAAAWYFTRRRPPTPVSPALQARAALARLKGTPENGLFLSNISHVVRDYCVESFALPRCERTTGEFRQLVLNDAQIGKPLGTLIANFLNDCDFHKFAPAGVPASLKAIERATQIVDAGETRLATLRAEAAATHGPPAASAGYRSQFSTTGLPSSPPAPASVDSTRADERLNVESSR